MLSIRSLLVAAVALLLSSQALAAPRVLLLVRGASGQESRESQVAESSLTAALTKAGFEVVDKEQLAAVKDTAIAAAALRGDAQAAVQLALTSKADLILTGAVSSDYVTQRSVGAFGISISVQLYRASITLKAIVAQTGQVAHSVIGTADGSPGISNDQAREGAVIGASGSAFAQISPKLAEVAAAKGGSGVQVRLTVSGLGSFSEATALTKSVEGVKGVGAVSRRSFGNGTIELDVALSGSVDDFAGALEGLKELPLEIMSVDGPAVVAKVKR
ncbi:MAG TPA: hypothetical protein VNT60_07965 [Deinococcales bacterium]|nr:hypothetical protein [Deinococcales bacterium]